MIYKLNKNDINTSEAYNKTIFIYKNNIIIPYINLEIFEESFIHAEVKKYDRLDFSYIIFKDVVEIFWNFESNIEMKSTYRKFSDFYESDHYLVDYIEAINIFDKHDDPYEFKIRYKEKYIYLPENVRIKRGALNLWIPVETPNFRANMKEREVTYFFSKTNIPNDILKFIDMDDISSLEELNW